MEARDKKRLWLYIAIAYGVAYAANLIMIIGLKKNYDLTMFVNTQMMYPACGVILGKLIFKKEGEKLPMLGYITALITTVLMFICSLCSVFLHMDPIDVEGVAQIDIWSTVGTLVIITGSVIAYVGFWVCGKEKSENAGLRRKNILWSVILVAVFIALFIGRTMLAIFLSDLTAHNTESWDQLKAAVLNRVFILGLIALPINYVFSFIAFWGEEYGWRYFLQPVLQKKMGKRLGVIILGVVWAFWHIGVDFMYYTTECGAQVLVSQIITCVVIAIFFGYAYMKTENIWVVVIMHYLNNNLGALLGGGGSQALQNQQIPWSYIPIHALSGIVFFLFIFAPLYNKKK